MKMEMSTRNKLIECAQAKATINRYAEQIVVMCCGMLKFYDTYIAYHRDIQLLINTNLMAFDATQV